MNELFVSEAKGISKNIELVTKTTLKSERYASENFQIMNYGIGGKISGHVDTVGLTFENSSKFFLKPNKAAKIVVMGRIIFKAPSLHAKNRVLKKVQLPKIELVRVYSMFEKICQVCLMSNLI